MCCNTEHHHLPTTGSTIHLLDPPIVQQPIFSSSWIWEVASQDPRLKLSLVRSTLQHWVSRPSCHLAQFPSQPTMMVEHLQPPVKNISTVPLAQWWHQSWNPHQLQLWQPWSRSEEAEITESLETDAIFPSEDMCLAVCHLWSTVRSKGSGRAKMCGKVSDAASQGPTNAVGGENLRNVPPQSIASCSKQFRHKA